MQQVASKEISVFLEFLKEGFMNLKGKYDSLFLFIGLLWIAIWIFAIMDKYIIAFMLSIILMLLHLIMGSSHDDKIEKRYLMYPLLSWALVWAIGFYLAYANDLSGSKELFFGFNASFGPVVYFYWIGGVLTLTLGYFFNKKAWLNDKQWEEFLEESKKFKEEKGGNNK